jgi:sigma-B regulation protein RsbU (phosphoserine phosphatase)
MNTAENLHSFLGEYLSLFANAEIFIFVFMEIVTKLEPIQRVMIKRANLSDYTAFILLFGGFSIFGTYIGIPVSSGGISNVRDLSPMVAGLIAGPVVGVSVGLIGGIHRFFLGGVTCLACSLATVLAGLLAGFVYRLTHERVLGIIPAMLFAVGFELIHAGLALAISRPYSAALEVVQTAIPPMIIANSLGLGISIIVIHATKISLATLQKE